MEEYRKTGRHTKHGMELVVEMLTTGYWPTQSGPKCSLPKQVVKCCKEFEEFYHQMHNVSAAFGSWVFGIPGNLMDYVCVCVLV